VQFLISFFNFSLPFFVIQAPFQNFKIGTADVDLFLLVASSSLKFPKHFYIFQHLTFLFQVSRSKLIILSVSSIFFKAKESVVFSQIHLPDPEELLPCKLLKMMSISFESKEGFCSEISCSSNIFFDPEFSQFQFPWNVVTSCKALIFPEYPVILYSHHEIPQYADVP
jgi:hypothetical protein